jgi:hypothetical protein
MASLGLVGKTVRAAVITGGLLMLACLQAQSAIIPKWFTESWQDHEQCTKLKGTSGTVCGEVSAGKFTITVTLTASTPGASGTLDPSLLSSSTPFDITLGGYSFQDATTSNFKFGHVGTTKTTAKLPLITQKCNAQGLNCNPNFKYENIALSISTKNGGTLQITITAVTGSDANGDTFETPIDANNFDGNASGPVTDNLFLQVDLGTSFNFNDADSNNVAVTGSVVTVPFKMRGTSVSSLSKINIVGKP